MLTDNELTQQFKQLLQATVEELIKQTLRQHAECHVMA